MSHFATSDSSVEFDAGTLPLGPVTFNYDFVVNDKVEAGYAEWAKARLVMDKNTISQVPLIRFSTEKVPTGNSP